MNTKYQSVIVPKMDEISGLISSGATDAYIAETVGITVKTLRKYRKQYPEFGELFQKNRAFCDDLVESALLKRATGYSDTSGKEVPPDVRAAVFWLQNRRPKRWKRCENHKKHANVNMEIHLSEDESSL